jgi:hypothetical protein
MMWVLDRPRATHGPVFELAQSGSVLLHELVDTRLTFTPDGVRHRRAVPTAWPPRCKPGRRDDAEVRSRLNFRCSITEAAEWLDAVVCAHFGNAAEAGRAGRVIVVGHSLVGLVARAWMGLMNRWPWCHALIALGTPHRAAFKALAWLVTGVPRTERASRMIRGWPSVTQVLPRYPANRNSIMILTQPRRRRDGRRAAQDEPGRPEIVCTSAAATTRT